MKLPDSVMVFDIKYQIEYVDKPSDVDIFHRQTLWGQCDFWTRTIRIYKNDRTYEDIMQTIWHEVLHAIAQQLHIDAVISDEKQIVDLLATGLNSVIANNNWVRYENS